MRDNFNPLENSQWINPLQDSNWKNRGNGFVTDKMDKKEFIALPYYQNNLEKEIEEVFILSDRIAAKINSIKRFPYEEKVVPEKTKLESSDFSEFLSNLMEKLNELKSDMSKIEQHLNTII